jgi:HD-like signal output (HDOD) protein
MATSIRDKILQFDELPTLPAAALFVLQLTNDEAASTDELAKLISKDPALSAKVLRAVNSSFYGVSQKVSTVSQAVVMLGVQCIKQIVLSFSLLTAMRTGRGNGLNHMQYWRRSMYAATSARVLAERVLPGHAEDCFVSALLMDLGMLVLDQALAEQYSQVVNKVTCHSDLLIAESHHLGITHAEAAGLLAASWKLPEILAVPMASHHAPMEVSDYLHQRITQVIWIGGRCADIFVEEASAAESIAAVRTTCCELYKLDAMVVDGILCKIGQKTREMAALFEVRLSSQSEYEQILHKASQRLLELTIGQEQASRPVDKRRSQRVRRDGKILIIPCDRGVLGKPIQIKLKDLSAMGIGLTHHERLEPGTQFVIQLPEKTGSMKTLLYTVKRCDTFGALFSIGAELASVLRPEAAKTEAA